ncbi:MAG TPA: hypothetical protein PKD72_06405, partial [Gemmatales bacterium]|nr:hypothetical protein [Gemmatales bacterium]
GLSLFILACVVFGIAAMAGSPAWTAIRFIAATIGLLVGAGAVLVASITAIIVGLFLFIPPILEYFG